MICRDLQADPVNLSCKYTTKKKQLVLLAEKWKKNFKQKKINENFFNKE